MDLSSLNKSQALKMSQCLYLYNAFSLFLPTISSSPIKYLPQLRRYFHIRRQ